MFLIVVPEVVGIVQSVSGEWIRLRGTSGNRDGALSAERNADFDQKIS